jgi:hypothetical protein
MKKTYAAESSSEAGMDLYQDETMAMIYVGDVYSLVAQDSARNTESQSMDCSDGDDTILPFIR